MSISNIFRNNHFDLECANLHVTNNGTSYSSMVIDGGLQVNGLISTTSNFNVPSTTQSNDTSSGALVVSGGVGIGGNINIQGNATINNDLMVRGNLTCTDLTYEQEEVITSTIDSMDCTTGASIVQGGMGIYKNLNIGGNFSANGNATVHGDITCNGTYIGNIAIASISSTIQATDCTTGAFTVAGGVGVCGNLCVRQKISSNIIVSDTANINSVIESTDATTGCVTLNGGIGILGNCNVGSNFKVAGQISAMSGIINSTNDSQSLSNGALVVNGGASVSKKLFVGGDLKILSTSLSNSYTTGSLVTSGGIGVNGDEYINGSLNLVSGGIASTMTYSNLNSIYSHMSNSSIHYPMTSIDHTQIQNIGTNTHATIDTHLSNNSTAHFGQDLKNTASPLFAGLSLWQGAPSNNKTISYDGTNLLLNSFSYMRCPSMTIYNGSATAELNVMSSTYDVNLNLNSPLTNKLRVDGSIYSTQNIGLSGSLTSGSITVNGGSTLNGSLILGTNNISSVGSITASDIIKTTLTTDSLSSTSGAVIIGGGAGVLKNLYVGGNENVSGTLTAGSLTVTAGTTMGGDLTLGSNNITAVGSINAGGSITSNNIIYSSTDPVLKFPYSVLTGQGNFASIRSYQSNLWISSSGLYDGGWTVLNPNAKATYMYLQANGQIWFGAAASNQSTPIQQCVISSASTSIYNQLLLGPIGSSCSLSVTAGNLTVDCNSNEFYFANTDRVNILNTAESISTSTGVLLVSGGVGIAKSLNVGSTMSTIGNINVGTSGGTSGIQFNQGGSYLSTYSELTLNGDRSIQNFSLGSGTAAVSIYLVRVGNLVTATFYQPTIASAANAACTSITTGGIGSVSTIPVGFRPTRGVDASITVTNNSTPTDGRLIITSAGLITTYRAYSTTVFQNNSYGFGSPTEACVVSWTLL